MISLAILVAVIIPLSNLVLQYSITFYTHIPIIPIHEVLLHHDSFET